MDKQTMLQAYYQMIRIRLVEERLVKIYLERNIRSFIHFCIGQEAIAVGVCMNLSPSDIMFGNFRSHGHYLAKGGSLKRMIAELFGKSTGCCDGRGGSMHLIDKSVGFMGSVPILASIIPIAVGAGFSLKRQDKSRRCVVFLGDGACGEGIFHESINFAAQLSIPILFIIENNLYSVMSNRDSRHSPNYDMGKVATGLGATYMKVNGNDVTEVYSAMQSSLLNIVNHPVVIECTTFRHMAHSGPIFDASIGYRTQDNWETRIHHCPIRQLKEKIIEASMDALNISAIESAMFREIDNLKEIEVRIQREISDAIQFADESPYPSEIMENVYAQ